MCTKRLLLILSLFIFLASCSNIEDDESYPPPLYRSPQVVPLNLDGYKVNQFTGDSVKLFINSTGDTVVTGSPVTLKGQVVELNSMSKPKRIKAAPLFELSKIGAKPNPTSELIELSKLEEIPINQSRIKVYHVDSINSDFVLLNEQGDTIPTGIPIPANGKVIPFRFPKPKQVLEMRSRNSLVGNIQYLEMEQGLPNSRISNLLFDSRNNIWFGTIFSGAFCYNGKSFINICKDEYTNVRNITTIFEDSKKNIWIGTRRDLRKYDGKSLTIYDLIESNWRGYYTKNIIEDEQGAIWLSSFNAGLVKFRNDTFTYYTTKEGLTDNHILSLSIDNNKKIWIGTKSGVCYYSQDRFTHIKEFSKDDIEDVFVDSRNNIWLAINRKGIARINKSLQHYLDYKTLLGADIILPYVIAEDKSNNIWLGTLDNGLYKITKNYIYKYTDKEGLNDNAVRAVEFDKNNNVWIGSAYSGIHKMKNNSFNHYVNKEGLRTHEVTSVLIDKRKNLWYGSGGVNIMANDSTYSLDLGMNYITSMLEDRKGNIWIATYYNLIRFDGENFYDYGEQIQYIECLFEDKSGVVWIGSNGAGLYRYKDRQLIHYTEEDGLPSNSVWKIIQDKKDNIWIGAWNGGVYKYYGGKFTFFSEKEGLVSNIVMTVLSDSADRIWIGTAGAGLCLFDGDSFTNLKEELSDEHIPSIIEDNNGNIWAGADNGLNIITNIYEPKFISKPIIHKLNNKDGLLGFEFRPSSRYFDKETNQLWWGTNKSLTMLNLDSFKLSKIIPSPRLIHLDINGKFIDYRSISDSLAEFIEFDSIKRFDNYPLNLKLQYKLNHLTFHYVAIDWNAPHKIRYSYRMKGLNRHWSDPTEKVESDFRNMPYGTFTFQLCAIGESQIWSKPFEYTFTIHPPWWHTWWARCIYGLATILIIYFLVKWRTLNLKHNQKVLEQKVIERTTEIENQKEELKQQNEEITTQRDQLSHQHQAITESILYAKRIQTAVMPRQDYIDEILPDNFILFKPKDKVSGDFYWIKQVNSYIVIAVADCTGHGVPGAIMSMLGISFINEIIQKREITRTNQALNELRKQVKRALRQTGKTGETDDGMDIALCAIDTRTNILQYSGANNSLYIIQNNEFVEVKADRMPIGFYPNEKPSFTNHEIQLQEGAIFYLFSDGFADQFGGKKGVKYRQKNFQNILIKNHNKPMVIQKELLEDGLLQWMVGYEQTDDILVMGVRI